MLNAALSIAVSLCVVVVANIGSRPGSWRRRGQERGGEVGDGRKRREIGEGEEWREMREKG